MILPRGGGCVLATFRVPDIEEVWGSYPSNFKRGLKLGDLTMTQKRNALYHYYATQIYGVTGRRCRCRMAECVVWGVRDKYPDPNGIYTGFSWGSNDGSASTSTSTTGTGTDSEDSNFVETDDDDI
jgi:hypothetical protein